MPSLRGMTRLVVATSLASLALPSASQAAEQPTDGQIVVTGQARDKEEVERQARQFVRDSGIARGQIPAARWLGPVCLKVFGLHPEYASLVERKFAQIASQVPVRLAEPGCRGNLVVVFAESGTGFTREIVKREPRIISDVPLPSRRELFEGTAPVRWWYSIGENSSEGVNASSAPSPWTGGNAEGGGSVLPMGDDAPSLRLQNASLVSTKVYRGILRATVVVDIKAAEGKALDAVAAYAAMVAYAEVRRGLEPPSGSILELFARPDPPRGLTELDLGLLRTVYRLQLDRTSIRHRARLAKGVTDAAMGEGDGK